MSQLRQWESLSVCEDFFLDVVITDLIRLLGCDK
jgi:hypothetical protein